MLPFLLLSLFNLSEIFIAELDGAISPASSAYLLRAIDESERSDAACLIIQLDTPGGLDESMREVTKRILNARIPVVVYVAPKGARAASAGVFILYASHVAAMAPGTNVGAAHPVGVGGTMDSIMAGKVTNDAAAYLRALAKERHRNEAWAERAVRESISTDAESARQLGVCEVVAGDIADLISKLNGRKVRVRDHDVTIVTALRSTIDIKMTLRERLLLILTNPNIAYVLLLLGIYGLFFELQNPGMIFPGVVGGICLIMAFYAMHLLPVNYAGVALILLSAILFILEIYITSHGILSVGGAVSLLIGSLILFGSNVPFFRVSWEVIMIVVVVVAAFFIFLVTLGICAQFKKPVSGREGLIGEMGTARTDIDRDGGTIYVHGEFWNAVSDKRIKKDSRVRILEMKEMTAKVDTVDNL
jgi:membrane-bound serine protease (ClpP class)